jgi:hypothetical protein
VIILIVHISILKIGDRVAADIFNDKGIPVLSVNKILTDEDIEKLNLHKIDYVDIDYRNIDEVAAAPKSNITINQNIPTLIYLKIPNIKLT